MTVEELRDLLAALPSEYGDVPVYVETRACYQPARVLVVVPSIPGEVLPDRLNPAGAWVVIESFTSPVHPTGEEYPPELFGERKDGAN